MTEAEIMTLLLEKPGLYIGYGSVVRIEAFIAGYTFAKKKPDDLVYRGFGQWLRKRFDIRQDLSWTSIVCFVGQSEAEAFEITKELWKKYNMELSKSETFKTPL